MKVHIDPICIPKVCANQIRIAKISPTKVGFVQGRFVQKWSHFRVVLAPPIPMIYTNVKNSYQSKRKKMSP